MFLDIFKKKDKDKDIVVVKIGGEVASKEDALHEHIEDIISMKEHYDFVIVSGGGGEISVALKEKGIESRFIKGQRYTDLEALDVVIEVLERNNKKIVNLINLKGGNAVTLSSIESSTITAARFTDEYDLGYVGRIEKVEVPIVSNLLKQNFVVVVSPVGKDDKGQMYNINADIFAAQLAQSLSAQKLVYMTGVNGILRDAKDPGSTIKEMEIDLLYKLIDEGVIHGGMVPKIQSCLDALKGHVREIDIVNGKFGGILKPLLEEGINITGTRVRAK